MSFTQVYDPRTPPWWREPLPLSIGCMFPPTFNGLLDFSVLPFNVVHHFVLLFLLLPVLELLLPVVSVSLFCLFLAGVFCGRRE